MIMNDPPVREVEVLKVFFAWEKENSFLL